MKVESLAQSDSEKALKNVARRQERWQQTELSLPFFKRMMPN